MFQRNLQLLTGIHSIAFQNTVIFISSDVVITITAPNKMLNFNPYPAKMENRVSS